MANETILKLNKMCVPANMAQIGTKIDTLIEDLSAGKTYSGDMLTDGEISRLDNMCAAARRTQLGTVIDNTLKASVNDTSVEVITDAQIKELNGMCIISNKVVDGSNKGLGTVLKDCQEKINAGAGGSKHNLSVDYDKTKCTISVKKGGVDVNPGVGVLSTGDVLTITATPIGSYAVTELKVNGDTITSGDTYTVAGNVSITAVAQPTYTLTISATHATVSVLDGETSISSGGSVYKGEVLTISATAEDGYENPTIQVNGQDFVSGSTYTVDGAVVVSATATPVSQD